jgi:hypothetical protein
MLVAVYSNALVSSKNSLNSFHWRTEPPVV